MGRKIFRRLRTFRNSCKGFIYSRRHYFWIIVLYTISFTFHSRYSKEFNIADSIIFDDDIDANILENVRKDPHFAELFMKTQYSKNTKYILLWTDWEFFPFHYLGNGEEHFMRKCSMIDCYFTSDRNYFEGDLLFFDAVIFNGRSFFKTSAIDLPVERSPFQKYIFFNLESADYYPICSKKFDGYFNWTATYKLDSNFVFPYITIEDLSGKVVGPKTDMKWVKLDDKIHPDFARKIKNKSKAVAWFVSRCMSKSRRKDFVADLTKGLERHNVKLDIYGQCGRLKCPQNRRAACESIFKRDYYFYLSLEDSIAEDYVTEELLVALEHDLVPIVYGGANYSRFLPPGSYIDARAISTKKLASLIHRLIKNPHLYTQYFRWKNHYSYHRALNDYTCSICEALNNRTVVEKFSSHREFRKWWNVKESKSCEPKSETFF